MMDPNLFHLDWERTFEVLVTIVVLSFIIERALSVLFESRLFIDKAGQRGFKELIAFAVSVAVCIVWKFDAVSMIILRDHVSYAGMVVTGGVVAGGSKASITLFRDVMGFMSKAEEARLGIKKKPAGATTPQGNTP